jgi:hypothetical protein
LFTSSGLELAIFSLVAKCLDKKKVRAEINEKFNDSIGDENE